MKVLKTLQPGDPGTHKHVKQHGKKLVVVRYRGIPKKNMRVTTVEIIMDQGFWMPYQRDLFKCPNVDIPVK